MSSAIPDPITAEAGSGHTRWVRISHWIVAASVLTLALTGFVILMAHPRLYWGAVGNDLTQALLELPISRNHKHGGWEKSVAFFPDAGSPVTAARTYDIFNENSWGRSLHILAAWFLVATGGFYVKYLHRIVVKDEFDDMGKNGLLQNGWSWYAGI
jgi:hypothetical protein